jgi:diaminopimelate epimerase
MCMPAAISFLKMHSAGNDFVIIDGRSQAFSPYDISLQKLADRQRGVGCDQVILLTEDKTADIHMRIFNADGTEVEACGNATRCVGWLIMEERGLNECTIKTAADLLSCWRDKGTYITAALTTPRFGWQDIPLAEERDTAALALSFPSLGEGLAVNVGNPHVVFFVDDVETVELELMGPKLEHHRLFPKRTNVEVVQVISPERLKMRVWERGSGLTQACGTGACATLVAAVQRGLTARKAIVEMPGGNLEIEWEEGEQGRVRMTGPVFVAFRGSFVVQEYKA